MPNSSSRPAKNVAAAAALQFSIDFDQSRGDSQPSVLLLTQNVGGIDAAYGGAQSLLDASPGLSPASDHLTAGQTFPSIVFTMTGPSYAQVPEDVDAEHGVSAVVRQHVADFLADLRTWLHRMSFVSAAARAAERATAGAAAAPSSSSSSPPARHTGSPSGAHSTAGQTAETFLRGYTPAARPPMVDVIVLHFQEIGGKYKNKQFNKYFRDQLSAALLPEAGWTSGLLMDERESDRVVVSSSACRPTRMTSTAATTAAAAIRNASPTSETGHLRAPGWDYRDSQSRRSSNEVSGTETDVSEEEADPFFTAMGSIVFLSPRIMGITSCLSVPHRTYIPIADDPITYAGEAGRLFHSGKFAEAGRSRKGFLMVSLRVGTVPLTFCNLHLFNDDDNRVAFEKSPSTYTSRRTRAVQEAMAECSGVVDLQEPLFLFGDYNVRLDGKLFLQWAEEKEQITIRAGKKQLRCPEHLWSFFADPARVAELRSAFDCEPQRLMDEVAVQTKVELGELPVTFAPTYSRLPYRQRGGPTDAALPRERTAPFVATGNSPVTERHQRRGGEGPHEAFDQLNSTQTPSAVEAAALSRPSSSPAPPPPTSSATLARSAAVVESLSHVMASPTRLNFSHDRLPAWCDRVLFNVSGLEWIAGDRARPQPSSSGTMLRDRRKAEAPHHRWYAYEAIDLVHMDHDGVYVLC